jgi:hypothetical protein
LDIIDKGSIHASQIIQQSDFTGEHGNSHMVAGYTGVTKYQVIGIGPPHADRGSGDLEDLRSSRGISDNKSGHEKSLVYSKRRKSENSCFAPGCPLKKSQPHF